MTTTDHNKASNAVIGNSPQILGNIHQKEKNIAIYQRDCTFLADELTTAMSHQITYKASGSAIEILSGLSEYFHTNLPECTSLLEDIKNLTFLFEGITKSDKYRLYFSTVNHDMCRKFHTDINDLRLLCTYSGKGTLWVPDEVISISKKKGTGEDFTVDDKKVQQAGEGNVLILKGALYPGANPILHRSPAIEKEGKKRLMLRIDTCEFLNFMQ